MDAADLNDVLDQVRNQDDFKVLMTFLRNATLQNALLELRTKRLGKHVIYSCKHPSRHGVCHYTLDDGLSVGNCRWENLHRVLVVR